MEKQRKEKKLKPYYKKTRQEEAALRRQAEANARRKVNDSWEEISQSKRYKDAKMKDSCQRITQTIKEEMFDGTLLNLEERSRNKSYSTQKRILRRIVDKRQAQSVFHTTGRTENMFRKFQSKRSMSLIMNEIHKHQFCA